MVSDIIVTGGEGMSYETMDNKTFAFNSLLTVAGVTPRISDTVATSGTAG